MQQSLTLDQIDLLVALQTVGTLTGAASLLNISTSAASHRLREAERRVGHAITTPNGRSLRLTPAAEHLADVGASIRTSLRSAQETARWMATADRPAVRIALDGYDTAPWYSPLVDEPGLPTDLDFVRVPYDGTADAVLDGRVDLGVILTAAATPVGDLISDDHLVGIVRCDHPAAKRGYLEPDDIATVTYSTMGDRPSSGFEHERFFEPARVLPARLRKVESLAMILRLLRRYGSITVQPTLALSDAWLDDLAVVPLVGDPIPVRWEAITRRGADEATLATVDAIRRIVTPNS